MTGRQMQQRKTVCRKQRRKMGAERKEETWNATESINILWLTHTPLSILLPISPVCVLLIFLIWFSSTVDVDKTLTDVMRRFCGMVHVGVPVPSGYILQLVLPSHEMDDLVDNIHIL